MKEAIAKLKNTEVFYRRAGTGPTLVLLHGFGLDANVWNDLHDSFPGHQLLIPDLPGTGRSPMVKDMSMMGMAAVISEWLEELKTGPVILIGHSMGGYITLAFAEKYSHQLRAFGLFHSTAYADSDEKKETRRKGIEFIKEKGAFAFLKSVTPNLFSPETREKHPELVEAQIEASKDFSPEALIAYYEGMISRPDRTEVLKQTPLPVLFIIGKFDQAVPAKDTLEQCYLPRESHVHIFEQSAHMGMKEERSRTKEALNQFLESCISDT